VKMTIKKIKTKTDKKDIMKYVGILTKEEGKKMLKELIEERKIKSRRFE